MSDRVRIAVLVAPLLCMIVAGCRDSSSRAVTEDQLRPEPGNVAPTVGSLAPGRGADSFAVTLTGPPREGTHRGSGDLACMVYNGLWQAHWEAPDETGLSGLLLQLKDVPTSGGSGTKLSFTATFGAQTGADGITAMIDVHGSEFGRDGKATVTREGKGATVRIEGTAPQGARITAVLRCASVNVMS